MCIFGWRAVCVWVCVCMRGSVCVCEWSACVCVCVCEWEGGKHVTWLTKILHVATTTPTPPKETITDRSMLRCIHQCILKILYRHMRSHTHKHIFRHLYIHTPAHAHAHVHARAHAHAHALVHAHVHAHAYAIYTGTQRHRDTETQRDRDTHTGQRETHMRHQEGDERSDHPWMLFPELWSPSWLFDAKLHDKFHGIRRVSNPATRQDLAARTWGVFWYQSKIPVLFEIMVQIKQKKGTGVESPSPRSFSGGRTLVMEIASMAPMDTISIGPILHQKSPAFLHEMFFVLNISMLAGIMITYINMCVSMRGCTHTQS